MPPVGFTSLSPIQIFQLLVPVLSSSSGKFYLLLILCALAPLLSWASFILARETTAKRDQPRCEHVALQSVAHFKTQALKRGPTQVHDG